MDTKKSLAELGDDLGYDSSQGGWRSALAQRCMALHRKPLNELSQWDLGTLLRQSIGVQFIFPLALEILERQAPTADEPDSWPLLIALLRIRDEYPHLGFWHRHQEYRARIAALVMRLGNAPDPWRADYEEALARYKINAE